MDGETDEFAMLKERGVKVASKRDKVRLITRGADGLKWEGYVIATSANWVKFERDEVSTYTMKPLKGIRFFPIVNIDYIEVIG
jgi:hypothetical protein